MRSKHCVFDVCTCSGLVIWPGKTEICKIILCNFVCNWSGSWCSSYIDTIQNVGQNSDSRSSVVHLVSDGNKNLHLCELQSTSCDSKESVKNQNIPCSYHYMFCLWNHCKFSSCWENSMDRQLVSKAGQVMWFRLFYCRLRSLPVEKPKQASYQTQYLQATQDALGLRKKETAILTCDKSLYFSK